jgi:transketolase
MVQPVSPQRRASVRVAYGKALADYGALNPDVVVLDADVSASTQTHYFAARFPDRFFNLGVAEAGMVDVAAGLALGGKVPFVNTFAFLLSLRAAEQIRTCVAYAQTNVKLAAAYGGLSDSYDGPTHHSVCDLAVMRAMPNLAVVVVADAVEAQQAVPAVAEYPGPVYLRLSRAEAPVIHDEASSSATPHRFRIGEGVRLRPGGDLTLVGTGIMVAHCLQAAEDLAREGIDARVVELQTLKPLDRDLIVQCARETGALVTAEEHSVVGGLGSAVAEAVAEPAPVPLARIGLQDCFAQTGGYDELLAQYGLDADHIVAAARRVIKRKEAG